MSNEEKCSIHSYRDPIFNFAIVDVGLTFIAAYIITIFYPSNVFIIFGLLVLISIPVHMYFGVKTQLLDDLGL